jgi:putative redox protein
MIEARAIWSDKERFLGEATSGHAIVVDASAEKSASSPVELVLIALCACTSVDVVGILRKKREPFTSLEVRAKAERSEQFPKIFTSIKLIYRVGGKVTHKAMEDAVRLSKDKYCSVSAMLQTSAKIEYEIEYADSHEHEKLPDQK